MIHTLIEVWQVLGGFALPLVLIQGRRIRKLRAQVNFERSVKAIFFQSPGVLTDEKFAQLQREGDAASRHLKEISDAYASSNKVV